jgi:predicted amidohydrolase YtcJ
MAASQIMVALQPAFTIGLGAYAEEALEPAREATQNGSRSLLSRGIRVSYGSDAAPYGPLTALYAAVTRRGWDGRVRGPGEVVSMQEALRLHTREPAFFTFDEKTRGSIEVGKVADFVVVSDDILTIDPQRITDVRIERTIVAGREIHVRSGASTDASPRR